MGIFVLAVAVVMALPFFIVWKQVYITANSTRQQSLRDSLSILRGQITRLTFTNETLADSRRIETIAQTQLALEYPSSNRIVIVDRTNNAVSRTRPSQLAALRELRASGKNYQ